MTVDETDVRAAHATWIAAVNAGELHTLLGLMTDDVVLISPGQTPFGRDGFEAAFAGGHHQFAVHCTSEPEDVVVMGDVACTCARDTLTLTPRDGGATSRLAGHRLTVYRRGADGVWRLARDAHTLAPVAEAGVGQG